MPLDEYLYKKITKFFARKYNTSSEIIIKTVVLNDIKQRLTILARALTGNAIEIFPAEREGGFKNNNFFLPASFSLFDTYNQNLSYYFFRVIYLSVQKELCLNWFQGTELKLNEAQQMAYKTSSIILEKMFVDYPITKPLFFDLEMKIQQIASDKISNNYTWLFGKWMRSELEINMQQKLNNFSEQTINAQEDNNKTVILSKAVEDIITIEIDKKQQEDYVMTHNFEKVETADEHSGIWRDFDGADELEDHQDALD
ncbi:MAG TPA: hypothetical protein PLZ98_01315, partial [Chitinophagaceae bacterium]|nr:hypothetical protein [Chitinophagaceae bacterium]